MTKIGEGMVSTAFLENCRVFLVGKRPNAFKVYTELKSNLDFFDGKIKSLQIPSNAKLIEPCNKYPLGAISFDYIEGTPLDKRIATCTKAQKIEIGKKLADFITEITSLSPRNDDSKTTELEINLAKLRKAKELIKPYLSKAENNKLQKIETDYRLFLEQSEFCMTHGDLHFENLIVDNDNRLVGIIDFGNVEYYVKETEFMWMQGYDDSRYKGDKIIFDSMVESFPVKLDANKIKLVRLIGAIRFFQHVVRVYTFLLDEAVPTIRGLLNRYELAKEVK